MTTWSLKVLVQVMANITIGVFYIYVLWREGEKSKYTTQKEGDVVDVYAK